MTENNATAISSSDFVKKLFNSLKDKVYNGYMDTLLQQFCICIAVTATFIATLFHRPFFSGETCEKWY